MVGYVDGGFEAWKNAGEEIDVIIDVEADELAMDLPFDEKLIVLDVRKPVEYAEGHVKDAINLPLAELNDPLNMAIIEDDQNVYINCGSGYRSVIAASLFKRQGIHNVRNIVGGWDEIKKQKNIDVEKDSSVLN
jgi:rhodanese-related sulfurtransferase